MGLILTIDPGPTHSGAVEINRAFPPNVFKIFPEIENEALFEILKSTEYSDVLIEMIASYGMPVGSDVFETCVVIGRIMQIVRPEKCHRMYRKDVKQILCHSMRARDANVRKAVIDHYLPLGGGKTPQIGTKNRPGPLYGVKSHAWSALALGVAWRLRWGEDM